MGKTVVHIVLPRKKVVHLVVSDNKVVHLVLSDNKVVHLVMTDEKVTHVVVLVASVDSVADAIAAEVMELPHQTIPTTVEVHSTMNKLFKVFSILKNINSFTLHLMGF